MASSSLDLGTFAQILEYLDKDGDGTVTKAEFKDPFLKLFPKKKMSDFESLWAEIDENKDNELSIEELCKYFGFDMKKALEAKASNQNLGAEEMTDEQILEALQMQAALAELEAATKEKKESKIRTKSKGLSRDGDIGIRVVKMPTKIMPGEIPKDVAFLQACDLCDVGDIDAMLESGQDVMMQDDRGETSLHKLARHGQEKLVRKLFQQIAKGDGDKQKAMKNLLNFQDKAGKTACHYAIEYKHRGILSLLLDKGADVLVETANGWTVLHTACNLAEGGAEFVREILEHRAVAEEQDGQVRKLLIKHKDQIGREALHIAACKSDESVVTVLLRHGANANVADGGGNSAAKLAEKSGRRRSMELIEEAVLKGEGGINMARRGSSQIPAQM